MWLTRRLVPDHKTIADFRKDNGKAIRQVCARFVDLCRGIGLLATASVAIDGSEFKAEKRGPADIPEPIVTDMIAAKALVALALDSPLGEFSGRLIVSWRQAHYSVPWGQRPVSD